MAINTVVTWGPAYGPSAEVQQLVADEIIRLEATGITVNSPNKAGGVTTRVWSTRESAQSWIDFINSLDDAPESAVIVEE
jgi:hypothetical protein